MNDTMIRIAVIEKVTEMIDKFNETQYKNFKIPQIVFSTRKARYAGQFSSYMGVNEVKFNMLFFRENFEFMMKDTVIHEVCHYLAFMITGRNEGHGLLWKKLMRYFGAEPKCCHNMELPEVMKVNTFKYKCNCSEYNFTKVRHNKVVSGVKYACNKCGSILEFVK